MAVEASVFDTDPAARLVQRGSGEQAAAYIRQLIFTGKLLPGTRLPQGEIAEALGISRIQVREAIVALEREGWVTTRFHHGAFVNSFDEDTIRDHYVLFGMVYGLACRRALRRNDPDLIPRLAEISREVARNRGPQKYRAVDADDRSWRRARRPKPCLLSQRPQLCAFVERRQRVSNDHGGR